MMRYDPFAVQASDRDRDDGREDPPPSAVLFRSRAPILQTKLSPLDWKHDGASSVPENSNKRPRPLPETDQKIQSSSSAPVETTRIVEKIVERVVTIPVSEPLTVMGGPPLVDDRVRNLVNFMLQHVTSPEVEVEAKFGLLFEKYQNVRACELLPVVCETPIRSSVAAETRFESSVHHTVFAHLNSELNRRVEETAADPDCEWRVLYQRTREVDIFWPNNVRETRRIIVDPHSGVETFEQVRAQRKRRLGDLNFICPASVLDVRYSASMEEDAPLPPIGEPDPPKRRLKDRISYKFDVLSIDITAVEMTDPSVNAFNRASHEIEVEIESSANLFAEVQKYRNGDPSSKLFRIATSLVNTVRAVMEEVAQSPEQQVDAAENAEAITEISHGHQSSPQRASPAAQPTVAHGHEYHPQMNNVHQRYGHQPVPNAHVPLDIPPIQVYSQPVSQHGQTYRQSHVQISSVVETDDPNPLSGHYHSR